jgi:hypothetical protein
MILELRLAGIEAIMRRPNASEGSISSATAKTGWRVRLDEVRWLSDSPW